MKEETSTWKEVGKVCFRDCATISRSIIPAAEEEPNGAGVTPTIPQGLGFGPKTSFRKRTLLLQPARVLRPVAHWWQTAGGRQCCLLAAWPTVASPGSELDTAPG